MKTEQTQKKYISYVYGLNLASACGSPAPNPPRPNELELELELAPASSSSNRFNFEEIVQATSQVCKDFRLSDFSKAPWGFVEKQLWNNHYKKIENKLNPKVGYV